MTAPKQALLFEERNINDYAIVTSETPSMAAITACFWANLTDITGYPTFVSYATNNHPNAFLLWMNNGDLQLSCLDDGFDSTK